MNKEAIKSKLEFLFRAVQLTSAQKAIINDVVMSIIDTAIAGVTEPGITKASNNALGGIKTGYSQNAKNYPVSVDSDGKAFVNVPWTDNNTTYRAANTTTLGLVKQAQSTSPVEEEAELSSVIATLNTLIANLKSAGVIANS